MAYIRSLILDPANPDHCQHMRYIWEGFVGGGAVLLQRTTQSREDRTFDSRRPEASIARALKTLTRVAILEATGQPERMPGGVMRELDPSRGPVTLILAESEHELLLKHMKAALWGSATMDEADDAIAFLTSAVSEKSIREVDRTA